MSFITRRAGKGEEGRSRGCKGGSEEGSVVANKVKRENERKLTAGEEGTTKSHSPPEVKK